MDQLFGILVAYIDGDEDFVVKEVNRIVDAGDGKLCAESSLRVLIDELPFFNTRMMLIKMLFSQYKLENEMAVNLMVLLGTGTQNVTPNM